VKKERFEEKIKMIEVKQMLQNDDYPAGTPSATTKT
jgi:hypothetical protein